MCRPCSATTVASSTTSFASEHEIDLIVERGDGRVVAMEVKLRPLATDKDVKHLSWLQEQIGPDLLDAVAITTSV